MSKYTVIHMHLELFALYGQIQYVYLASPLEKFKHSQLVISFTIFQFKSYNLNGVSRYET